MSRLVRLDNKKILATKDNVRDILRYIDEIKIGNNVPRVVYKNKNEAEGVPDKIDVSLFIQNPITRSENYVFLCLEKEPTDSYYTVTIDEDLKDQATDFINGFTAWKLYKYAEENGLAYYTDSVQTENGNETVIYFYQQ